MKIGIDRFGLLMHNAARLMRRRFELRAHAFGLSSAQWRLLVHLSLEGNAATQARLAEVLEIEPISVSRLVDRMEQAGWVRREADAQDRRGRRVVPTLRAQEAYAAIKAMARDVYEEALDGVPDAARAELVASLNRIIENLSGDTAAQAENLSAENMK